jgi:type VII secretion integral membrane protein EccD
VTLPVAGLVRITIRSPRRRVDLSVPHLVPLAEILPEVVVRAGEERPDGDAAGWVLRRGDGARLAPHEGLSAQGVSDGAVLYLVPGQLAWPEPRYDDLIEEIADSARAQSPMWTTATTRVVASVGAAAALSAGAAAACLGGLGAERRGVAGVAAAAALVLLAVAIGLARFKGDHLASSVAGAGALAYFSVAAFSVAAAQAAPGGTATKLGAGGAALLAAATIGGLAVGSGLSIFVASGVVGAGCCVMAVASGTLSTARAAAVLAMVVIAGVAAAPLLSVRLGRVPFPVLSADPRVLAEERRPPRAAVAVAVARADGVLTGLVWGLSVLGAGCAAVLGSSAGLAAPTLGLLASLALAMRARLFPAVWARLPLLVAGAAGACLAGRHWVGMAAAESAVAAGGVLVALGLLMVRATTEAAPAPAPGRLYLGRLADLLDVAALVALAPLACAVLDLYGWVGAAVS